MAQVTIKITGKQSSRVFVKYAPGENAGKNGEVRSATLTTKFGKPDWDAMADDDGRLAVAAGMLSVFTWDLKTGIANMQEQTKQMGPAVYRAFCGKELCDRTDGTRKPKVISEVRMGFEGDERNEVPNMRTQRTPPEACLNCPKLRAERRTYKVRDDYEGPGKDEFLFDQTVYMCKTFTLVPGAVPLAEEAPTSGGSPQ